MPSPMAGAPTAAVHATPASSATLIACWSIVPSPLTAMSATSGCAAPRQARSMRHSTATSQYAKEDTAGKRLLGQQEPACNNGRGDACRSLRRLRGSMQRRAGEPELRDLFGGRERKLLEISLGFADVLRQPRLVPRPQQEDCARRLEAESRCTTQDHR